MPDLPPDPAGRLAAIRGAGDLAALQAVTDAASEHEAYLAAKREWPALREWELRTAAVPAFPGVEVTVGDLTVQVHGVTHADTDAEAAYLREHVDRALAAGEAVFCEQGIRSMYFAEDPDVCGMDDYRWAMDRVRDLDAQPPLSALADGEFDALLRDVGDLASRFRSATFSLIDGARDHIGDGATAALGDLATSFLTSHEDLATGEDFTSFVLSRRAATDPTHLADLQRYYERTFLPQPLEREWLRRHDPHLEVVTHARSERMADYVLHTATAGRAHVIVGAAHQPGVRYYLEATRDGRRRIGPFEPVA